MAVVDLARTVVIAASSDEIGPLLDGPWAWERWQPGDSFRILELTWSRQPAENGPRWWGGKFARLLAARARPRDGRGSGWDRYDRSGPGGTWLRYDPATHEVRDWFATCGCGWCSSRGRPTPW